ncbi:glycoside hydrolase family 43 protein [Bifidobacterium sp. ESL0728]|uniref:glycoside hydrolase family 43 protein n=1 Tax=Bifidobacterium sp. ESL0728 TaxID=2983220 RepID=UPI0023FA0DCD|nr:glycoside hydrolase family 43 protein [Bifidobacterium sp. ESL0728]WEV58714.1 glycoside hydrolase family 43 protein [Bifidobacterium sp. ESL0728]
MRNPVLRGFNPDPVIFSDGQQYYIVVSTFEWLPGLRVYASDDLCDWHYETSILDRDSGIDLRGNPRGCSIWAPYAGYHNGKYYVLYTNVRQTKVPYKDVDNYLITATDIHGPWSEPVYINSSGFDPSLFFDDDGKTYFINEIWDYRRHEHNKSAGIVMQRIDSDTFDLCDEPVRIFPGTEAQKTEAPQMYKCGGYYYLLVAEGGTESGHRETVARSRKIWGPYKTDPQGPLVTSYDDPTWSLQCAGHASLVMGPGEQCYMAHLCARPFGPDGASILGRETALQHVVFDDNGWIRLADGGHKPSLEVLPQYDAKPTAASFRDDLRQGLPDDEHWNTLREFPDASWLQATSDGLRIAGGASPQSTFEQHLIGTRQTEFDCRASVRMLYAPKSYLQLAGLSLYLDVENYMLCMVTANDCGESVAVLQQCVAGNFSEVCRVPVFGRSFNIRVGLSGHEAAFIMTDVSGIAYDFEGPHDVTFLAGGFTGNFIALDAIDMYRHNSSSAVFSDFQYEVLSN